jgi:hypothetical protein
LVQNDELRLGDRSYVAAGAYLTGSLEAGRDCTGLDDMLPYLNVLSIHAPEVKPAADPPTVKAPDPGRLWLSER